MNNLAINKAIEFLKKYEDYRENAYKCIAGQWTIGYGTSFYSNGEKVKEGDKISKEQAEKEMLFYINKHCVPEIFDIENAIGELNDGQVCAIVSVSYNVCRPKFKDSKCKKFIMINDITNACKQWNWIFLNGIKNKGLINRRNKEIELFYGIKNYWVYE